MPRLECATEIDERSPRTGKLFRQACGLAKTKSDVRPESVMTAERLVRGTWQLSVRFLSPSVAAASFSGTKDHVPHPKQVDKNLRNDEIRIAYVGWVAQRVDPFTSNLEMGTKRRPTRDWQQKNGYGPISMEGDTRRASACATVAWSAMCTVRQMIASR